MKKVVCTSQFGALIATALSATVSANALPQQSAQKVQSESVSDRVQASKDALDQMFKTEESTVVAQFRDVGPPFSNFSNFRNIN